MTLADVDAVTRIVGDPYRVAVTVDLRRDRTGRHPLAASPACSACWRRHPQVFVAVDRPAALPHPLRRGHRPAGGGARRLGRHARCSATATRSASRSRSPGVRFRVIGRVRAARAEPRRRPRRRGAHPGDHRAPALRHQPGRRHRGEGAGPGRDRRARRPDRRRAGRPAPRHRVQRGHPGADPRRARRHPRACSPACWPPSPASRCWSAASASPTSCWSRCASGPGRSACARRSAPGRATSALQFLLEAVLLTTLGGLDRDGAGRGRGAAGQRAVAGAGRDHLVVAGARVRRLRRRWASSSGWCRPSGPAGSTRWSRCAPSDARARRPSADAAIPKCRSGSRKWQRGSAGLRAADGMTAQRAIGSEPWQRARMS